MKSCLIDVHQGCQMVYFQTKKSQFGYILEGLGIESVGIFYGRLEYTYYRHLLYVIIIWNILRPFDIFFDRLVYFVVIWYNIPQIWYVAQRKIWQPCCALSFYLCTHYLSIRMIFFQSRLFGNFIILKYYT
jgi:hypothetical protein